MANLMEVTGSNLSALADQYRAITNNLANANTTGYKRQITSFQQVLDQFGGGGTGVPGSEGMGMKIRGKAFLDFTQGVLQPTGRRLDVALEGKGFLVIDTPQGPHYTRNGTFSTNTEGQLVDQKGNPVSGESGPITIPSGTSLMDVVIGGDGTVSTPGRTLGKLKLLEVENPDQLKPIGVGGFRGGKTLKTKPAEDCSVHQGYQEQSNVAAVEELVNLIRVSRLYEAGIKSISSHDERLDNLMKVAMR